jgi:hypothetical protein
MDKWGSKFSSEIHLRTAQKYMQILSKSNEKEGLEKEKALALMISSTHPPVANEKVWGYNHNRLFIGNCS